MRKVLLLVGALLVTGAAVAADLKEGQDYVSYNPPRSTETQDRIEVTEFFWYGCGHCFHLEPELNAWVKKLPKDVSFRRVPAVFPGRGGKPGGWAPGARLFYTLEALGQLDKLHGAAFNAIQVEHVSPAKDQAMIDWAAKQPGIDAKKFADTYNSFAVESKLNRAMQLSQSYGLDGVPALVVNGQYRAAAVAPDATLAVVDQLIDRVRKERGKK